MTSRLQALAPLGRERITCRAAETAVLVAQCKQLIRHIPAQLRVRGNGTQREQQLPGIRTQVGVLFGHAQQI